MILYLYVVKNIIMDDLWVSIRISSFSTPKRPSLVVNNFIDILALI